MGSTLLASCGGETPIISTPTVVTHTPSVQTSPLPEPTPMCTTTLSPITPKPSSSSFRSITYQGHSGEVDTVAWQPAGKFIASGSRDSTVQVWQPVLPNGTLMRKYTGHTNWVFGVAWSPDSKLIASCSADTTVQVWDAIVGNEVSSYTNHSGAVHSVAWSPDGKLIASGSDDTTVQVWDAATGGHRFTYNHHDQVHAVAWSPNGKYLALSGSDPQKSQIDNTVEVLEWDTSTNTGKLTLTYRGHNAEIDTLAWSPDSKYIVSGSLDHTMPNNSTVQVWDATTGCRALLISGHNGIRSVAWSPDSSLIAFGTANNLAYVFDRTGQQFFVYHNHTNWVHSVTWSPDSGRIASSSADTTVQVWQVK